MGKLIQFKIKPKKDSRIDDFLEELECTKALFLQGDFENIFIIAHGKDSKDCTSSGVTIEKAKEMCIDFIRNSNEYTD